MAILNLHHLRLFRAVARDGTLTGAARALNLSQSALSTQIKALETSLGHDLFERRGRGLVLTEAGRIALDHADAIFRTAEDLSATLGSTGTARRALRIGALATLSRNFQVATAPTSRSALWAGRNSRDGRSRNCFRGNRSFFPRPKLPCAQPSTLCSDG